MSSFFESDLLFDPMDRLEPDSFLSFSSLSDFSSPPLFDGYDSKPLLSGGASVASDTSSLTPSDPFEIVAGAFGDDTLGCGLGDVGIFHTPTKMSNFDDPESLTWTHRSSGSADTWGTPLTPSPGSMAVDQFTFGTAGNPYYLPPHSTFSWDETTPTLGAGYSPSTPSHQPHRIASNPVIGSARQPRVKQVTSMPALREEDQPQYFGRSSVSYAPAQQMGVMGDAHEEALVEGLPSVFGSYGLGERRSQTFSFHPEGPQSQPVDMAQALSHHTMTSPNSFPPTSTVPSWQPAMQAAVGALPSFTFPTQLEASLPMSQCHTIDPMAVMMYHDTEDDASRPSSAPGSHGGEHMGMLSVPKSESMSKRSLSSSGYVPSSRSAPPRALFSYVPQAYHEGPPEPQPLYTSSPHHLHKGLDPSHLPRSMPRSPTPRSLSGRTAANGLTIITSSPDMPLFHDSDYPPTPKSDDVFYSHPYGVAAIPIQSFTQPQPQPIAMQRAETTPIPGTHMRSVSAMHPSMAGGTGVQMHGVGAGNEHVHKRARRVSMTEAISLREAQQQQLLLVRRPQTTSTLVPAQIEPQPILTHTPLHSVHPPPAMYMATGTPTAPHRVHPPPHPGGMGRPIARLPSPSKRRVSAYTQAPVTPSRTTAPYPPVTPQRRVSSKPRSPSMKKKAGEPGAVSFGDDMFVNFTMEDGEALLSGVAPSGTSGKRRRDVVKADVGEDRERSKRSRSDD